MNMLILAAVQGTNINNNRDLTLLMITKGSIDDSVAQTKLNIEQAVNNVKDEINKLISEKTNTDQSKTNTDSTVPNEKSSTDTSTDNTKTTDTASKDKATNTQPTNLYQTNLKGTMSIQEIIIYSVSSIMFFGGIAVIIKSLKTDKKFERQNYVAVFTFFPIFILNILMMLKNIINPQIWYVGNALVGAIAYLLLLLAFIQAYKINSTNEQDKPVEIDEVRTNVENLNIEALDNKSPKNDLNNNFVSDRVKNMQTENINFAFLKVFLIKPFYLKDKTKFENEITQRAAMIGIVISVFCFFTLSWFWINFFDVEYSDGMISMSTFMFTLCSLLYLFFSRISKKSPIFTTVSNYKKEFQLVLAFSFCIFILNIINKSFIVDTNLQAQNAEKKIKTLEESMIKELETLTEIEVVTPKEISAEEINGIKTLLDEVNQLGILQ